MYITWSKIGPHKVSAGQAWHRVKRPRIAKTSIWPFRSYTLNKSGSNEVRSVLKSQCDKVMHTFFSLKSLTLHCQ